MCSSDLKQLPTALLAKAGPRPIVQLFVDDNDSARALLPGVRQALQRGGFDVVVTEQPGALKLQVSLKMTEAARGLRKGEVVLSEVGKASAAAACNRARRCIEWRMFSSPRFLMGVRGARDKPQDVDSIGVCCKLHLYE